MYLKKIFSSLIFSSLIVSSLIVSSNTAHAGAWVQEKGHGQVITTVRHSSASKRYTTTGQRVPQATYQQQELNPYVEYGLTPSLTVGANLFALRADDSTRTHYGVGDSEWFARQRVWQNDRAVLSVQPMVKLPSPHSGKRSPIIGSDHADVGMHALAGTNFQAFGRSHYAELDAGYRHRFGAPNDQARLTATLGARVNERISLLPQVFHTQRLGKTSGAGFTQSPRDDYTLTTGQISVIYTLSEQQAVQAGAFTTLYGRNTGQSTGALISYWRRF